MNSLFYPYMTPSGAKTIYEYVILPIHDPVRGQNFQFYGDSLSIHDPLRGQSYTLLNQKFI